MRALLVLWVSGRALTIIGCCVAMWDETATGKGGGGYPWKAFLFGRFQISVSSIMYVRNLSTLCFAVFTVKKKTKNSDRSLRGALVVDASRCNNVADITSCNFIRILPFKWRQKKKHWSDSLSLSQTVCPDCLSLSVFVYFSLQLINVGCRMYIIHHFHYMLFRAFTRFVIRFQDSNPFCIQKFW